MAEDDISEQLRAAEEEEQRRYGHDRERRHENPLGEEHLRRQIPEDIKRRLNPTADPDRDKMLQSYEAMKHGGLDDFRTKLLQKSIGVQIRAEVLKGGISKGTLIHFDEQYGQLVIEGRKHSPPEIIILLLKHVTRLVVGSSE